jgi:hypothetical protein
MDETRTIVRQHFEGAFTLEDYAAVERDTHALIAQEAHTVDVLCDLRAARHLPSNLASLSHRPARHVPPNMGRTLIVGAPFYIRRLAEFAGKLRISRTPDPGGEYLFIDTLEEALARLGLKDELSGQSTGGGD